jgi:hypothetical protein
MAELWLPRSRAGSLTQHCGANFTRHLPLPDIASLYLPTCGLGRIGAWVSTSKNPAGLEPK